MVQNMLSINVARTKRSLLRLAKLKNPTNELTKKPHAHIQISLFWAMGLFREVNC